LLAEQDARFSLAQQPHERSLPVQEWEIAQILAIMLDQVARVEDRGSSGLPTGQLLDASAGRSDRRMGELVAGARRPGDAGGDRGAARHIEFEAADLQDCTTQGRRHRRQKGDPSSMTNVTRLRLKRRGRPLSTTRKVKLTREERDTIIYHAVRNDCSPDDVLLQTVRLGLGQMEDREELLK
jgi:hypothetical protein